MLSSKCLLLIVVVCTLLKDISAVAPRSTFRKKREVGSLNQDLLLRMDDQMDLSVVGTGVASSQAFQLESLLPLSEHQHQLQRKAKEKRRKVPRLDSIGKFQMSMKP